MPAKAFHPDVSDIAAVQDHYMYHSASANNAKGMVAIGSASYEAGPSTPSFFIREMPREWIS